MCHVVADKENICTYVSYCFSRHAVPHANSPRAELHETRIAHSGATLQCCLHLCPAQNSLVWYCRRQICGLLCHHSVCQPSRNRHWLHSHCWRQYGVSHLSLTTCIASHICFPAYVLYVSFNAQHSDTNPDHHNGAFATLSVCLSALHSVRLSWSGCGQEMGQLSMTKHPASLCTASQIIMTCLHCWEYRRPDLCYLCAFLQTVTTKENFRFALSGLSGDPIVFTRMRHSWQLSRQLALTKSARLVAMCQQCVLIDLSGADMMAIHD